MRIAGKPEIAVTSRDRDETRDFFRHPQHTILGIDTGDAPRRVVYPQGLVSPVAALHFTAVGAP